MTATVIRADDIRPGDLVRICGRPETVTRIEAADSGRVHVYTPDDPSDPYLFHTGEDVPLLHRD